MKRLKKGLVVVSLGCLMPLLLGSIAGPAVAVPAHRHCMLTPQGYVEVAPGVVEHAPHDTAFHQFHSNVHVGSPPTTIIPKLLTEECP